MKLLFQRLLIGIAASCLAPEGRCGIVLSLEPLSQETTIGTPFSVELVISGLGDYTAPSLGAFSFDLNYDPVILTGTSVAFGTYLNLNLLGSIQSSSLTTPGVIHLDEVSLESVADLTAGQPSSFILATLGFKAVGLGSSVIDLASGSLSDATGQLSLSYTTESATVTAAPTIAVPDANSTAVLVGLGLAGLLALGYLQRIGDRFVFPVPWRKRGHDAGRSCRGPFTPQ